MKAEELYVAVDNECEMFLTCPDSERRDRDPRCASWAMPAKSGRLDNLLEQARSHVAEVHNAG